MAKFDNQIEEIDMEEGLDFDFADSDDESVDASEMLETLVDASRHQMDAALELTRLILDKHAMPSMAEAEVIEVFKRASDAIAENFPMKKFWEVVGQ